MDALDQLSASLDDDLERGTDLLGERRLFTSHFWIRDLSLLSRGLLRIPKCSFSPRRGPAAAFLLHVAVRIQRSRLRYLYLSLGGMAFDPARAGVLSPRSARRSS